MGDDEKENEQVVQGNEPSFAMWFGNEFSLSKRVWKGIHDVCVEMGVDDARFLTDMARVSRSKFEEMCRGILRIDKESVLKRFVKGIQVWCNLFEWFFFCIFVP